MSEPSRWTPARIEGARALISALGLKQAAAHFGIKPPALRNALRRAGIGPRALRRRRAAEVLARAAQIGVTAAAREAGVSRETVRRWRQQESA